MINEIEDEAQVVSEFAFLVMVVLLLRQSSMSHFLQLAFAPASSLFPLLFPLHFPLLSLLSPRDECYFSEVELRGEMQNVGNILVVK